MQKAIDKMVLPWKGIFLIGVNRNEVAIDKYQNLFLFFLVFVGALIYSPVFFHDFQWLWDDQWVVVNFYTEGGLNRGNIWRILTDFYEGQYAPLNQLYYTILFSFFGYNSIVFHVSSVVIHLLNTVLIFKTLRLILSSNEDLEADEFRIAFISALLFVVSPVLVEPVAWLAASKVLIYAFFYLFAIHSYVKYLLTCKVRFLWLTALYFVLSFGGKEQAVTLPVCLLLFDWLYRRDFRSAKVWAEKAPFFLLAFFFGYITMQSQAVAGTGALTDNLQYPFYQRVVFACYSIFEYFIKCLVPIKLSYIYPFPNQIGEPLIPRFWIYPILLLGVVVGFWNVFKKKWMFFSLSFFLIHIAVT